MIEKRLLEEVLGIAVSTGADFAEAYSEQTRNGSIRHLNGKIEAIGDNMVCGVGIRAFVGTKTVYASTSDVTREGLIKCAKSVAAAVGEGFNAQSIRLTERIFPNVHPVKIVPSSADMGYKCDLLKAACSAAREYDERVVQAAGNLITVDHSILIANTEGLLTTDRHLQRNTLCSRYGRCKIHHAETLLGLRGFSF